MPEGDTIHSAARRIGAALVGRPIESIQTPQPRHALDRWPERLAGRAVRAVDAHGKHLFVRFDDGARGVGDVLLDQGNVAGIGNIWKAESCFAAGVSPWRALRDVDDAE